MTRIFVIEDDRLQRKITCDLLKKNGFEVESFETGENFLAHLYQSAPPDLVLLDLHLPGKSGFEVCTLVKERPASRGIPIVVITASNREEDIAKAFESGAVDYICKPFRQLELVARLRSHLRSKAFRKKRNFYELLKVDQAASPKELKAGFLDRVRACHPDHLQHLDEDIQEFALEKMKLVNEAYDVLKNTERRAIYDRCLGTGENFVHALTLHFEEMEREEAQKRDEANRPDPIIVRYMEEASVKVLHLAIEKRFSQCKWQAIDSDFFDLVLLGHEGMDKYLIHIKGYTHLRTTDLATLIKAVPDFCTNPTKTPLERDHFHVLLTAAEMESQSKLFGAVTAFNGANEKRGPRQDRISFAIVDIATDFIHFPFAQVTKPAIGELKLKFK